MRIGEFSIWEKNYSDTKCSGEKNGAGTWLQWIPERNVITAFELCIRNRVLVPALPLFSVWF